MYRYKYLLIAVLALLGAIASPAQTTVTATVFDPNGNLYANGTVSYFMNVGSGQQPRVGNAPVNPAGGPVGIDNSGHFSITLVDDHTINPSGVRYIFTVCGTTVFLVPNLPQITVCFNSNPIDITGPGIDISSQLAAVALPLGPKPGGGGGGGVSSFSSVGGAPLFSTSVTAPNTAPILNFTLSAGAANTFWNGTIFAQPTFSNISGTALDAQLFSSYSGIGTCGLHNWVFGLVRNTVPTCTQPGFGDLSNSSAVPSYFDVTEVGVPSNPASGFERWFASNVTHTLSCITSTGSSCAPSGGGGSGTVTPGAQYSLGSYNQSGTVAEIDPLPAPSSIAGIPFLWTQVPGAPAQAAPPGIVVDARTTITEPPLSIDRTELMTFANAGAITAQIPDPSGDFGQNYTLLGYNIGPGLLSWTRTTAQINGGTSPVIHPAGWLAQLASDNANWRIFIVPTLTVFPDCHGANQGLQFTLSTGVFSCGTSAGGGGTSTIPVTAETANFSATFGASPVTYSIRTCASPVTATLPSSAPSNGQWIVVTNTCNIPAYVLPGGALTLAGQAAAQLLLPKSSMMVIADGSNYDAVGSNGLNSLQPMAKRFHRMAVLNVNGCTFDKLGLFLNAFQSGSSVNATTTIPYHCNYTSSASANGNNGFNQSSNKGMLSGSNPYYSFGWVSGSSLAAQRNAMGFTSAPTSSFAGATADTPATFGEYFLFSSTFSDSTHIQFCTGDGVTTTCTNSGVTAVASTYYQLEIQEFSHLPTPAVGFWINDVLVGVKTSNFPTAGNLMETIAYQSNTTTTTEIIGAAYLETYSDFD